MKKTKRKEITEYDSEDVTSFIDINKPLKLKHLGLKLPEEPPTKVVSIRIPTRVLNKIMAKSSQKDIPYQAFIKEALAKAVGE